MSDQTQHTPISCLNRSALSMLDHPSSHSVSLMSGMICLLILLTSPRQTVSEIHLIRLTCQATWSLANTPIVVFITVIFSSVVLSCSVLRKFCVFFTFSIQGQQ